MRAKYPWQEALSDLITDPKELIDLLALDPALLQAAENAACVFPLKVPRGFIARIEKGNPDDPLLKQILPLGLELREAEGYVTDPLEESKANPVPGVLHKYHGRILVTLTSACAVHCRYCFRRHFPYADNNPGTRGWEKIMSYIKDHDSIEEVILSGGDPLSVNDTLLEKFSYLLSGIPHVKRLRIHTRLPIVLPERITDEFAAWISNVPFDVVMVVHANHPNELNDEVQKSLLKLKNAGICMLNQSVLLKGVNDKAEVLAALSKRLFSLGVLPYYLHVMDKVKGTAHFDMAQETAMELQRELTRLLPGYLVPKFAREEAGKLSKTVL